ncbi:PH domain-containing protein [Actinoplanes xinjiangensis]|uniref:PH domain-containing protein n=1 Tax=Actinoplanes xinjiangensis TaxID=512350 RepID=UPI003421384F
MRSRILLRIRRAGAVLVAALRRTRGERSRPVLRVRKSGAVLVAALIALVGTAPLAGSSWALSPLFLIPIAALVWSWRAGTDVYPEELRVRALFGGTRVPFARITEFAPDRHGRVSALLDNGNIIRLTGVTRENLPTVLEASDHLVTAGRPDTTDQ